VTTPPDQATATAERLYDEAYKCLTTGDYPGFAALCAPSLVLNLRYAPKISLDQLQQEAENWRRGFVGYGQAPTQVTRFASAGGNEFRNGAGTDMAAITQHFLVHSGPFRLPNGITIDATSREINVRVATFVHAIGGRIDRLNILLLNTDDFLAQMKPPS